MSSTVTVRAARVSRKRRATSQMASNPHPPKEVRHAAANAADTRCRRRALARKRAHLQQLVDAQLPAWQAANPGIRGAVLRQHDVPCKDGADAIDFGWYVDILSAPGGTVGALGDHVPLGNGEYLPVRSEVEPPGARGQESASAGAPSDHSGGASPPVPAASGKYSAGNVPASREEGSACYRALTF